MEYPITIIPKDDLNATELRTGYNELYSQTEQLKGTVKINNIDLSIDSKTIDYQKGTFLSYAHYIDSITLIDNSNLKISTWIYDNINLPKGIIIGESKNINLFLYFSSKEKILANTVLDAKELKGAEINFTQDSHHTIKIYAKDNTILVITNKNLTWENIYKLKILQWQLIKDNIEEFIPEIPELYKAFLDNNIKAVNKLYNKLLHSPIVIENKYKNLEHNFKSNKTIRLEDLTNQLSNLRGNIKSYTQTLNKLYSELNDKLLTYNAINETEDNFDPKAVVRYLAKHPYIVDVQQYATNIIKIMFHSPVLYYDQNRLKNAMHYKKGKDKQILTILKPENKRFTLYTRCAFRLNTVYYEFFTDHIGNGFELIQHPHIDDYGCLGNAEDAITQWAKKGDIIGMIEQMSAATMNINFTDTPVIDAMIKNLKNNHKNPTFKDNETGEFVDLDFVLEHIKVEDEE